MLKFIYDGVSNIHAHIASRFMFKPSCNILYVP